MGRLKSIIIKSIAVVFGEILVHLYGDILKVKSKIIHTKNGLKKDLLITIYERKLYKLGSWIGYNSVIEKNPVFPHGIQGIFISCEAHIGANCVIFQQVTIGSNSIPQHVRNGSPTIGDNCYIGAGAKIIGRVTIGDNCRIGANCVVVKDIPDNCVVVQSSPRIIQKENLDNKYSRNSTNNTADGRPMSSS